MGKVMKITENNLRKLIRESIMNVINEDMSFKHNSHTYDDYLDDDDFLTIAKRAYESFVSQRVSIEDFTEEEYREKLIDEVTDMIIDFVDQEAVNNFGYKYGELYGPGYENVAEHIVDFLEDKFKKKK